MVLAPVGDIFVVLLLAGAAAIGFAADGVAITGLQPPDSQPRNPDPAGPWLVRPLGRPDPLHLALVFGLSHTTAGWYSLIACDLVADQPGGAAGDAGFVAGRDGAGSSEAPGR